MKCLNCNNEINDNSNFCKYCGTKINNNINNGINNMQTNNNINNGINNNLASDFKTLDGVMNLYRSVNGIGQENCIIVALKDQNVHVTRTAIATGTFGLVGTAISGAAESHEKYKNESIINSNLGIDRFDGLILNKTENGLGIIPLINEGSKMIPNYNNYRPELNNYVFVNNDMIQSIELKKYSMFNSKIKKLTIQIQGNIIFNLTANTEDKQIPYQKDSMIKYINMFEKK